MSLSPGQRLGPYEIESPLGAGGMGEVYRARDTRLDRSVAVKVLPSHLASDPELRARFEREARAVSALSHPHICVLHDIGEQDGVGYMVMEHLEGQTLADRLERGPLPLAQALRVGAEIADALDRAHHAGIVHRDVKPANVMLTRSGAKLLDFGLARDLGALAPTLASTLATQAKPLTQAGTLLGTYQYMAPEQLEGREADARTDIFGLGTLVYEMVTGRHAFEGKSQASLIAAIMSGEPPPMAAAQPLAPTALERLVRTCLAKDRDERWQSAGDVARQLRGIGEGLSGVGSASALPSRAGARVWAGRAGWIVAAVLGAALVASLLRPARAGLASAPEVRLSIAAPVSNQGAYMTTPDVAISRDGSLVVFVSPDDSDKDVLWLRSVDSLTAVPLPGTEGARRPFFSPDGRFIGFGTSGRLQKIPTTGGPAQPICSLPVPFGGGAWHPDGTILFGLDIGFGRKDAGPLMGPLLRVPAGGGEPEPLLQLDTARGEQAQRMPVLLPDGRHVLVQSLAWGPQMPSGVNAGRTLVLVNLDSRKATPLVASASQGAFVEPDYLVFARGNALMAQRLRLDPPGLEGEPVLVAPEVAVAAVPSYGSFAASGRSIVYRPGSTSPRTRLAWFDRAGRRLAFVSEPAADASVSLSPDERSALVARVTGSRNRERSEEPVNIWRIELERGIATRLTLEPTRSDENPTWSPDGRRMAFASHDSSSWAKLMAGGVEGGAAARQTLPTDTPNPHPIDWSRDGRHLLIHTLDASSNLDLASLSLDDGGRLTLLQATQAAEGQGQFSPDGRFVAYASDESGRSEIYVGTFPTGEARFQVSAAGGWQPRWRRDGRELFYLAPDGTLMSVAVTLVPGFEAAPPKALFAAGVPAVSFSLNYYGGAFQYDVTRDGSRFLVNTVVENPPFPPVNAILNWRPPESR